MKRHSTGRVMRHHMTSEGGRSPGGPDSAAEHITMAGQGAHLLCVFLWDGGLLRGLFLRGGPREYPMRSGG